MTSDQRKTKMKPPQKDAPRLRPTPKPESAKKPRAKAATRDGWHTASLLRGFFLRNYQRRLTSALLLWVLGGTITMTLTTSPADVPSDSGPGLSSTSCSSKSLKQLQKPFGWTCSQPSGLPRSVPA